MEISPDKIKIRKPDEWCAKKRFKKSLSMEISENTTQKEIFEEYRHGVRVCDVFPAIWTQSKIEVLLAEPNESCMAVRFHSDPSNETELRAILEKITQDFPDLSIVIESVASEDMVRWIASLPENSNVGASVMEDQLGVKAIKEVLLAGHKSFWYGGSSLKVPTVIQFFKENGQLDRVQTFTSELGADFYMFERNQEEVVYKRQENGLWIQTQ